MPPKRASGGVAPPLPETVDFRASDDDAWYSVRLRLEQGGGWDSQEYHLRVMYCNFPEVCDERFREGGFADEGALEEFSGRFRLPSVQLQDWECRGVVEGLTVCASYVSGESDVRFYDAVVEEVCFSGHKIIGGREMCTCTFVLLWQHGPNAGRKTTGGIENVCLLQQGCTKIDPALDVFLELSRKTIKSARESNVSVRCRKTHLPTTKDESNGSDGKVPVSNQFKSARPGDVSVGCTTAHHATRENELSKYDGEVPVSNEFKSARQSNASVSCNANHHATAENKTDGSNSELPIGNQFRSDTRSNSSVGCSATLHATAENETNVSNSKLLANNQLKSARQSDVSVGRNGTHHATAKHEPIGSNSKLLDKSSSQQLDNRKETFAGKSWSPRQRLGEDIDLGGGFPNKSVRSDVCFYFFLIENLEKDMSPETIVNFIHQQTSILSHVHISPSLMSESYTRGTIFLETKEKADELLSFLQNPEHIFVSSRGRPWVITDRKLRYGFAGLVFKSERQLLVKVEGNYEIKVVHAGTKEYAKAKKLQDLFVEFHDHLQHLHKRLALEETKLLQSFHSA